MDTRKINISKRHPPDVLAQNSLHSKPCNPVRPAIPTSDVARVAPSPGSHCIAPARRKGPSVRELYVWGVEAPELRPTCATVDSLSTDSIAQATESGSFVCTPHIGRRTGNSVSRLTRHRPGEEKGVRPFEKCMMGASKLPSSAPHVPRLTRSPLTASPGDGERVIRLHATYRASHR